MGRASQAENFSRVRRTLNLLRMRQNQNFMVCSFQRCWRPPLPEPHPVWRRPPGGAGRGQGHRSAARVRRGRLRELRRLHHRGRGHGESHVLLVLHSSRAELESLCTAAWPEALPCCRRCPTPRWWSGYRGALVRRPCLASLRSTVPSVRSRGDRTESPERGTPSRGLPRPICSTSTIPWEQVIYPCHLEPDSEIYQLWLKSDFIRRQFISIPKQEKIFKCGWKKKNSFWPIASRYSFL